MRRLVLALFAILALTLALPAPAQIALQSSNATKLKGKPLVGVPVDGESWCLDAANNRYIPCSAGGGSGVTSAQLQAGARLFCEDSGSTDDYSCATTPAITAFTTGMVLYLKVNTTSAGAATVDIDAGGALAAKAIKLRDGTSNPADGDLVATYTYRIVYDGAAFQVYDLIPYIPTVDLNSSSLQENSRLYCADAGASDAYACNASPNFSGFTTGMVVYLKVNTTNTGAASVDIDSAGVLASKAIKKQDGSTDPSDGDLLAGNTYLLIYDGTVFRLNTVRALLQYVSYAAAVCQNTTASLGFSLPTSNPAVAACVTGSNTQYGVAQFADGANALSVQGHFALPADWLSSGIAIVGKWRTSATTGSVVWQVQTACVADAQTADPAWNTASTVTEAAKGTTLQLNDFSIASVTITGCAANEELFFKFLRDPAHASDDLAATAELVNVTFAYRRAI